MCHTDQAGTAAAVSHQLAAADGNIMEAIIPGTLFAFIVIILTFVLTGRSEQKHIVAGRGGHGKHRILCHFNCCIAVQMDHIGYRIISARNTDRIMVCIRRKLPCLHTCLDKTVSNVIVRK